MIIKKIIIKQFLSHKETILEMEGAEKFLLDGKSGSGKSSIVDALVWGLYGKGRSDNRALIKVGCTYAEVGVELAGETQQFLVTRRITDKGKQELFVLSQKDGEQYAPVPASGLRELQAYIEKEILGCSYLLFINSIVFLQDNAEVFVRQSANRRKEIILEIIKASAFDEYYNRAKEYIAKEELFISGKTSVLEEIKESVREDEILCQGVEESQREFGVKEAELERLQNEVEILESYKLESDKNSLLLLRLEEDREKRIKEISTKEALLREDDEQDIETAEKLYELKKTAYEKARKQQQQAEEWEKQYLEVDRERPVKEDFDWQEEEINRQMIAIIKKKVEFCSELNKPCVLIEKQKQERLTEMNELLSSLNKRREEWQTNNQKIEDKLQALGKKPFAMDRSKVESLQLEADECRFSLEGLRAEKKEKERAQEELGRLRLKQKEEEKEIAHLKSKLLRSGQLEELTALRNLVREKTLAMNDLRLQYERKRIAAERLEKNRKRAVELEKETADKLRLIDEMKLLKDAFGNTGIKAMLIDQTIPRLEDKINEILGQMSEFRITLDTQRKGVNGDTTLEGLFIYIINEKGEILDYDSYSGGEKMKINVAIFEALASLSRLRFRFFDETFFALDQESGDDFLTVIEEILKNVDQFVCVSHMQNIKDFFEKKILIQKTDGNSFII